MHRQTVLHYNNLFALHQRLKVGNGFIPHVILPVVHPLDREKALPIGNQMRGSGSGAAARREVCL